MKMPTGVMPPGIAGSNYLAHSGIYPCVSSALCCIVVILHLPPSEVGLLFAALYDLLLAM